MTRNVQPSAPVARAVALALLLSGASLGASGCAGDEGEGSESGSSEGSSGGETTMAPATATGLTGAPGSVAPAP
ncbi:MAG: hypothetical protein IPG17_25925 [Sandaracinaceae bacterium]|nr:hypothetical protein [Sandaracinaceae bacterium]